MPRQLDLAGATVLVTGASGFLGSRTVTALGDCGCAIRALVRKTSRTAHLGNLPNVTVYPGDVADAESLRPAFAGVDYTIHTAADTRGDQAEGERSTVQGTRNILTLAQQFKLRKLVYISSCSVYGTGNCLPGEAVTEESPLEPFPERRGPYTLAKCRAERLVVRAMERGQPVVCLRPGTIYGPGGQIFTPMLGFSLAGKAFAIIGNGRLILPLVYIDNLVEAILVSMTDPRSSGRIYNVVDSEKVTKRAYMEGLVKKIHPRAPVIYLPFGLLRTLVSLQEKACAAAGKQPFLTRYRLNASQNPVVYEAERITRELAWRPPVATTAAFAALVDHLRGAGRP